MEYIYDMQISEQKLVVPRAGKRIEIRQQTQVKFNIIIKLFYV